MDLAWVRREVRKQHVRKAAQVGVSEAIRNIVGYMAHVEPDPVLLVLPDEKTGKRVMSKRVLPLFEDTPCLDELKTDADRDQGLYQVLLANGFNLQLGWTGSAATLAADPARLGIVDETDKSKEWTGKESGPVELVDVRTTTYENSLVITSSTPTTDEGPITVLTENAPIKLWFYCPCPACGFNQTLAFEQVKYPKPGVNRPAELDRIPAEVWEEIASEGSKNRKAALVDAHRAAWYECEKCKAVVLDHQKQRMLLAGYWGTGDGAYKLYVDNREEGDFPVGSEVAMHYPAQLSLAAKHKFYRMASEWIRCAGDPQRTQNFFNSWRGEPFKLQIRKTEPNRIREKAANAPAPLVVPKWARLLIATVDVQGNDPSTGYFYFVVRAWSYGYRSQLIDYGIVNTFEEVRDKCLDRRFAIEGGGTCQPKMLLIDSGDRTDEVYQFALSDPDRIKPTKGSSVRLSWPVQKSPQRRSGVVLWNIDTQQTKDLLNRLMTDPDPEVWRVHRDINDDYCQQLCAETKSLNPRTKREEWAKRTSSTPNHLLDCEQQQCAAAWDEGAGTPEPPQTQESQDAQEQTPDSSPSPGNWATSYRNRH
jgi:phage terminase large subunit GpA-like protein